MERLRMKFVQVGSGEIPPGVKKGGCQKAFDDYASKPKIIACNKALTRVDGEAFGLDKKEKFAADAAISIEGWGNYASPDRGDELMPKDCWNLENFLKNPIYLWNHWHDEPIGVVTAIEAKDEGLYFSAQVGNPIENMDLTDGQKKARSLLAQGIVKMNSVGFLPKTWHEDDDGNLVYDEVELLEISLVPIPMQQDSVLTNVKRGGSGMNRKNEDPTASSDKPDMSADMAAMKADMAEVKAYCKKMHDKMCPEGEGDGQPPKDDEEAKALKKRVANLEAALVNSHSLLKKHNLI